MDLPENIYSVTKDEEMVDCLAKAKYYKSRQNNSFVGSRNTVSSQSMLKMQTPIFVEHDTSYRSTSELRKSEIKQQIYSM